MTPALTINLLRSLFVTFSACIGLMIGDEILGSMAAGGLTGAAVSLIVVLADRLLHGITLRVFSSATLGLLIGFLFSKLLLSSKVLAVAPPQTQWVCGLIVYAIFSYIG